MSNSEIKKPLQFGGHSLVWAGDWSQKSARFAASSASKAGYDLIEILIAEPEKIDAAMTRDVLAEFNLKAAGCFVLNGKTDISSADKSIVKAGEDLARRAIDKLAEIGGVDLDGPFASSLQPYDQPATKENRDNSVQAMKRLADYAADKGINLNIEIVNRYESNLMNTAKEGLVYLDEVDKPNVYLHLDTYHMNIEEDGMVDGVLAAADRIGYVHIGESHRGYLGTGNVDFDSFFGALKKINYSGPITFESFSSVVVDPALSNALRIWRNLWDDSDDLADKALKFMKQRYS
jgi:D-psicose/D-tagatose/L-ribulose 3-epimerase